jgi:hypothetical protein
MKRFVFLLGVAAAALAVGAPASGAANVLSLDKYEETGPSLITAGTEMGGYADGSTLTAGKVKETCAETGGLLPVLGDMRKNHSATDEIVYPFNSFVHSSCTGSLKLQKPEATIAYNYILYLGAHSETKGATLSLNATENTTKHVYPATFSSSLAKPFILYLEETTPSALYSCSFTGVTLSGRHYPAGESANESASLKGSFKLSNAAGTCPKSVTASLGWIPTVASDSFNPFMYGFIEP